MKWFFQFFEKAAFRKNPLNNSNYLESNQFLMILSSLSTKCMTDLLKFYFSNEKYFYHRNPTKKRRKIDEKISYTT